MNVQNYANSTNVQNYVNFLNVQNYVNLLNVQNYGNSYGNHALIGFLNVKVNVQNFDNLQGCIFGLSSNVNVNVNVQKTVQKLPRGRSPRVAPRELR